MDTQKEKNTINGLYVVLIFSTICSFVPNMTAQMFSLVLLLVALIAAYFYRMRAPEDGLVYNHMTYMIGTIWNGSTLIVIGMLLAAYWVYSKGDHTAFIATVEQIKNGRMLSESEIMATIPAYMEANKQLLIISSLTTIGPGILYVVYRVANGFSRSLKGYRIANPKSWL